MSSQVSDLEVVLQQLIAEHRKLLALLEDQQAGMKRMDLKAMEQLVAAQEPVRMRIVMLDRRRRLLAAQIGRLMKITGEPTIGSVAAAYPARAKALLALRDELRPLIEQVRSRAYVAGRVAGAVLGHLNTAMRLLAGAVGKAGVYTKAGIPKAAPRIGVMNAVG
jgi:hypothetical protein